MRFATLRRWSGIVVLLVAPCLSAVAAGPAGAIIDSFSPEVFRRCGLDRLSSSELAELKQQLDAALAEAALPQPAMESLGGEAAFGREEEVRRTVEARQEIPERITSRIAGEFRGWSGDTVFRLENGQVWRQTGAGSAYARLQSPAVTVERASLGAFFLRVEGLASRVRVKRLK